MSHVHFIEDPNTGDLTTLRVFCSDYCHRLWCNHNGEEYGGWNGCHETSHTEPCGWCLTPVIGLDEDADDYPPAVSFDEFTFYGDTGRWRVSADDTGRVTATDLLPGNGLFARDGESRTIGIIRPGSPGVFLAQTPGYPHADGWQRDGYTDPRHAATGLVDWFDDCRADALDEGGDD